MFFRLLFWILCAAGHHDRRFRRDGNVEEYFCLHCKNIVTYHIDTLDLSAKRSWVTMANKDVGSQYSGSPGQSNVAEPSLESYPRV